MHSAGDKVKILVGELEGTVREITWVRIFATDKGYYVKGGEGLYAPDQVELVEAVEGNPCGSLCDARHHSLVGACGHCMGKCRHTDTVNN
ncbi:hypothetical protein ABT282_07000 [Streptomyces sp. NPDC000927]|uniref:hypothetical protein n=1 Tax=Streptomyces sp. NPDC000927 TaxID=3154371 RepID=UPI00332E5C8E